MKILSAPGVNSNIYGIQTNKQRFQKEGIEGKHQGTVGVILIISIGAVGLSGIEGWGKETLFKIRLPKKWAGVATPQLLLVAPAVTEVEERDSDWQWTETGTDAIKWHEKVQEHRKGHRRGQKQGDRSTDMYRVRERDSDSVKKKWQWQRLW